MFLNTKKKTIFWKSWILLSGKMARKILTTNKNILKKAYWYLKIY